MAERYAPTARTRIRRLPKRAQYDRAAVHAVLDAGVMCHVGYVIDEQPYVTPTLYWRHGERLYWHGSSASRMLRHLKQGVRACVTVAHFDGLVLARSGFHHSVNYRSVMALGTASLVPDEDKLGVLEDFVEHILPGRWPELRRRHLRRSRPPRCSGWTSRRSRPRSAPATRSTTRRTMRCRSGRASSRSGPPSGRRSPIRV
jgi:nitroimidazol reductase NimA-like FMN-containing flavoprotein (pyridoxamine 5'-phosphate oxidase superfamily)